MTFSTDFHDDALDSALGTLLRTSVHYDDEDYADGTELDNVANVEDYADEAIDKLREMLDAAIYSVADLCTDRGESYPGTAGQFGHDFILTANGHGAGFWDRGYGALGDAISDIVRPYGEIDAYLGDDGQVYID